MNGMRMLTGRALAGLAIGAALGMTAGARADVEAAFANETLYNYNVTHVPDHDQVRFGLASNGTVHCTPTATINWMCYFANHGQPAILPGPGNWSHPANYGLATDAIFGMGIAMATAPPNGTNGYWAVFGTRAWLNDWPVIVLRTHIDDDYCPRMQDAAMLGMGGAYVVVGVGWYLESADIIVRDGGHSLSLTRAARNGNMMEIGWRDPGSHEGDLGAQSPFATETYAVQDVVVVPIQFSGFRAMSKIVGYGGGGHQGYIDSLTFIQPLFCLTPMPDFSGLLRHEALSFAGVQVPPEFEYVFPVGSSIVDMDFHPDMKVLAVLEDDAAVRRLYCIDLLTGEVYPCDDGLDLIDPKQVTVGRMRDIYVVDGDELVRCKTDQDPPATWRVELPSSVEGMVYDGAGDWVLLLSPETHEVLLYDHHLDLGPLPFAIPPQVPIGANPKICWNVYDNSGWLVSEASSSLWRMVVSPDTGVTAQEIAHPALTGPPSDIQAGDFGRVLVSVDGEILEFLPDDDGNWDLAPDQWFADVETSGGPLLVPRSQTNYQAGKHDTEEFRDVLPDEFAEPELDCDADVVEDGVVDVADLVGVIVAWGETGHGGFIRADVDQDGEVAVNDLVAVITAWGPCP